MTKQTFYILLAMLLFAGMAQAQKTPNDSILVKWSDSNDVLQNFMDGKGNTLETRSLRTGKWSNIKDTMVVIENLRKRETRAWESSDKQSHYYYESWRLLRECLKVINSPKYELALKKYQAHLRKNP